MVVSEKGEPFLVRYPFIKLIGYSRFPFMINKVVHKFPYWCFFLVNY